MAVYLYLKDDAPNPQVSDLIYVSNGTGTLDGKMTLNTLAGFIQGVNQYVNDAYYAQIDHEHLVEALSDASANAQSFLQAADYSAMRTALGVAIGTNVQAYSANLDEYAAVNPTAAGLALLDDADASAQRTTLGLAIGTDVQAFDADLTALAALSGTNTIYYRSAANTWSAVTIGSGLDFTGGSLTATGGAGVSDGDKGDVVVSSSGTVWALDTTGVAAGTYKSVTVDTKGRVTAATGFRGALVRKAADQTGANYTSATAITWDAEEYDTDAIHDNVTNNTRLTVPSGVTRVRVGAIVATANVTADVYMIAFITKGGATVPGLPRMTTESGVTNPSVAIQSPVLAVTAGEYFEVTLQIETDNSIDVTGNTTGRSCFWMEIIE